MKSNTNYWLLFASNMTWRHLRERNEWAFADKSHRKVQFIIGGDRGIVYLGREKNSPSALGGIVELVGRPYRSSGKSIFDGMFPIRIHAKILVAPSTPVPFKPLVSSIGFIKNKHNWGSYLQGRAFLRLEESDYDLLADAISNQPHM